jgi:site-specific recombinase XerC
LKVTDGLPLYSPLSQYAVGICLALMYDPIQAWIDNVCASHSNSIRTRQGYLLIFQGYCKSIERTATEIIQEYESATDRDFKRKHAQYVKAFISLQHRNGIAPSTISMRVGVIRSFYKYNDLPLGFVPAVKPRMLYHNRDITHEEVKLILDASRPREKAFYALMAQSGLRPNTICNLKYQNIKQDLENNRIPCKIEIPQEIAKGKYHSYFTFVGEDAIKYLRAYLSIRRKIRDDDYLFLSDDEQKNLNPKSISKFFAQTVQKLHEKDLMNLKQKKETKPHDIRLYNLRKFFRKYANQAGFEFVQFWMGHTVNAGQDDHYRPTDEEYHRKLYAEKAMPHLRLETATPTETDKAITTLEEENRVLKEQIQRLESVMGKMYQKVFREEIQQEEYEKYLDEHPEIEEDNDQMYKQHLEMLRNDEEFLAKHPEERKRREEQAKRQDEEYEKYLEEHEAQLEEEEKWMEEQRIRLDERRKTLKELQEKELYDLIKKAKERKK